MLVKNCFMAFLITFLVVGVYFIVSPNTANAGAVPGCCITNGGQCSPSCGPAGSSCQNPDVSGGQTGSCKGAAVPGEFCFQITNNQGICQEGPAPTGCTTDGECDDSDICTDDTCNSGVCSNVFNSGNDASCVPPSPPPATTIVPTLNQWGIILTSIILGFFAVFTLWKNRDSEI